MKRLLSVFLTIITLLSLCFTAVATESEIPYEKFFYSIFEPEVGNPDAYKHIKQATDPDSFYEIIKNIGEKSKELKGEDIVYIEIHVSDFLSHEKHVINHGGKYPEDDGQYRSCYRSCRDEYMTNVYESAIKLPEDFLYEEVNTYTVVNYVRYKVKTDEVKLETISLIANSDAIEKIHFVSEQKVEIGLPIYTPLHPYNDIKPDAWYYDYVTKVYDMKLMFGTSVTTFEPNATLTRAMLVTIIGRFNERINGTLPEGTEFAFSDVKAGKWYSDYVAWAAEKGVVEGYPDGSFRPDAPVTREEAVTILGRYYHNTAPKDRIFNDELITYHPHNDTDSIADWARNWVLDAMMIGAVDCELFRLDRENPEYYFEPKRSMTRAEAAKVAYVYLNELELSIERGYSLHNQSGYIPVTEEDLKLKEELKHLYQ
ncbi:MAG: S-layer homology domain-containing protein [Clostridia bacterium]|nr:S-layer homology domain-containing protein [Clostridia bacterium]